MAPAKISERTFLSCRGEEEKSESNVFVVYYLLNDYTVHMVFKSYRHHSVLPVMFVIRQNFSDLGQLVLKLSVGVDLDTETFKKDTF